jgi:DNA-binding transcriptional LysR family regulator
MMLPGDFDLNLLRVLLALDRTRHVTRAAELLGMSQSGFSSALARLRRHSGDVLFLRTSAGMTATPRAQRMIELFNEASDNWLAVERSLYGADLRRTRGSRSASSAS